jgi:hypothetical protein
MDKTLIHCPSEHGHYGTYVKYLLDYVAHASLDPSQLVIVLPHTFRNKRADVAQQAQALGVQCEYVSPLRTRSATVNAWLGALHDWHIACERAKLHQAKRVVFLNFDALAQMRLPFTGRLPFRVSGILYRPFPHYHTFPLTHLSPTLELKRARQEFVLRYACKHPTLEALYWLDPYAARYMNTKTACKNVWLPDPVETGECKLADVAHVRRTLGVTPQDRVWLVFGADIVRKGSRQILHSLPSSQSSNDVTLALVGPVYAGQEAPLQTAVRAAQRTFPGRIVVHDTFVEEAYVPAYFAAASSVFTLYHHHMGSSGAFVRAAAAGKPVLCTDFGLLGHLTHEHHLGVTCNVSHALALCNALDLAASGAVERAFDPARAHAFAAQHDKFSFAQRVLTTLESSP